MDTGTGAEDGIGGTGLNADVFAKRLPDDCVEYLILVIDEKIKTEFELRESLKKIQNAAKELEKKHLNDYIWQRDGFSLLLERTRSEQSDVPKSSDASPSPLSWVLHGSTNFGDSIADEWHIVYLLRELSSRFPTVWIRLTDTDGEFLLIEAANALPKWLNPEIADNRIWLHDSKLQIIPPAEDSPIPSSNLTLKSAITHLLAPSALLHDPSIDKEAFFRTRHHPSAISTNLHHARVRIPRRLAFILHALPRSISGAIEAFYLRDPIALKPLATKDTATLLFPPEDFVTVSVRFNRAGYAQLKSQEFAPPPSWTGVTPHLGREEVRMGMKLACGMEMMVGDQANADKRVVREVRLLLEDVEGGEELPGDEEIKAWKDVERQDDEGWLDIEFGDLERELDGKGKEGKGKFGDQEAQENLRRMVGRFEEFMKDEKAGVDGVDLSDGESTGSSEVDSEGEDKDGSFDEEEFEKAMREMMGLPQEEKEKNGLVDEARKLALEMEDEEEMERDDDEEARKIMEMMERELKGRGGLDIGELKKRAESGDQRALMKGKGPERMQELEELSSDDDMEENEVDVELLRNVLESFKGQAGLSGPASSMMAAMGIQMPRDEGDVKGKGKGKAKQK
ncbi:SGT1-like protein [Elsinoe fawcettii]|nr:SGT1-like protein [Elsinoe fawcettii]